MQVIRVFRITFVLSALAGRGSFGEKRSRLGGTCKENHTPEEYKLGNEAGLKMHNIFRCMHNAPPMVLSDDAIKVAQDYSDKQVAALAHGHSGTAGYGENMFSSGVLTLPLNLSDWMISATQAWYSEIEYYIDFDKGINDHATGHFTQVIWKESVKLGIGAALGTDTECGDTQYVMVVGNYQPPGNMWYQEAFDENVEGKPSRTEEYCTRVIEAMIKRSPGLTYLHEKYSTDEEIPPYSRRSPGYTYLIQNKPTKRRSAGFFYSIQNHPSTGVRSHISRRSAGFFYSIQNHPSTGVRSHISRRSQGFYYSLQNYS